MSVCISRQVRDGEVLAQGLATPLVAAGYLLAWHTHAPHCYFASAIGQSVCREGAPLGLARIEALWLDKALATFGFVQAVADLLPRAKPKEFFRPGRSTRTATSTICSSGATPLVRDSACRAAAGFPM